MSPRGLIKGAVFGFIVALNGLLPRDELGAAARRVSGGATTNAVVSASILILASNYLLTELFFTALIALTDVHKAFGAKQVPPRPDARGGRRARACVIIGRLGHGQIGLPEMCSRPRRARQRHDHG